MENPTKIVLFKNKQVRKTLYNNEWWFSIIDIIETLTDSLNPNDYWYKMKIRVKSEDNIELSTICRRLKLLSLDGKKYETDCVNTEDAFRIVQSIPSPKAEPFKRWLAKVGYERVKEIEDPELATKRTRLLYKLKGYVVLLSQKRIFWKIKSKAVLQYMRGKYDKTEFEAGFGLDSIVIGSSGYFCFV